jgi:hypothetical protein
MEPSAKAPWEMTPEEFSNASAPAERPPWEMSSDEFNNVASEYPQSVSAPKKPGPFYTIDQFGVKTERPPTRKELAEFNKVEGGPAPGWRVRAAEAVGSLADVRAQIAAETGVDARDVQIMDVPDLGLVYKTPDMEKFSLVDPAGFDAGDVVSAGLGALPAAASTIAGIGAGAVTKSPAATALASGAAAGTVRGLEKSALRAAGVISAPWKNIFWQSLAEGALDTAAGVAPGIFRGILNVLPTNAAARRRVIKKLSEVISPELLHSAEKNSKILADKIEKETGVRPKFTTGQKVAMVEPERAADLAALERGTLHEREALRDQRVAKELLEEKLSPDKGGEYLGERAAAGVKTVATKRYLAAKESIQAQTERDIKRLEQNLSKLPDDESGAAGAAIRDSLVEGDKLAYAPLKREYKQLEQEFSDVPVNMTGIKKQAVKMSKDSLVFKNWAKDRNSALSQLKGIKNEGTIGDVQRAIKDIRARLRVMTSEGSSIEEIKDVEKLRDILVDARNNALAKANPERANQILELEASYRKYKDAVDKTILSNIMKKNKSGLYTVADRNILNSVIKNKDDLGRYLEVAKEYPELDITGELKNALLVKYRKMVVDAPGIGKHQKFMQDNGDAIRALLSKKEQAIIRSAARAKEAIPRLLDREKKLIENIREVMPEYKLSQFSSTQVMDKIKGDVATANKVKALLERSYPDKWRAVQEARKAQIIKKGDSLSGLKSLLDNEKEATTIILGKRYVKTLETALALAEANKKSGIAAVIEGRDAQGITDIARATVLGPLSRIGYVRTKAVNVLNDKINALNRELLRDPKKLEKLMRAYAIKNEKNRAKAIAAATGMALYMTPGKLKAPRYKGK